MTLHDPWRHWLENLEGRRVPLNPGNPFPGFYRTGQGGFRLGQDEKDYPYKKYIPSFTPVAYWPENGILKCRIGKDNVDPVVGEDVWVSVCDNPVGEENYRNKAERPIQKWDDEHELVGMGHNEPPEEESLEGLRDEIEPLAESAKKRLAGSPVMDQDEAHRLGNLADALSALWKRAEEARVSERKPYDEALKAIQAKWLPILHMAEIYKTIKYKLLTPWQIAQKKAQEEAARAAVAAGQPIPETEKPRAGTRGKAMTLRTFKSAEITNFDECLNHFRDSPDIKATVQDLANKAVRAGLTVPGAKLVEEQRTV